MTRPAGVVQAVRGVPAGFRTPRRRGNAADLQVIFAQPWQSTLTAKQVELQFRMKFVKKITNSTNRGRNQLFVRIGAFSVGVLSGQKRPTSADLA